MQFPLCNFCRIYARDSADIYYNHIDFVVSLYLHLKTKYKNKIFSYSEISNLIRTWSEEDSFIRRTFIHGLIVIGKSLIKKEKLRRTDIFVPIVSALERFYCIMPKTLQSWAYISDIEIQL